MYEHFRTNDSLSYAHNITDLTSVAWCGDSDEQIERFRNNWDGTIAGMVEELNDKLLSEILLEQMLKSSVLKEEIMAYRRLKKEDPAKSYNGLLDIMDRHLVLAHQRKNRTAQVRANNQRNASTTAAPGVCRKFLLGKCGNKNCNQEHPSGQGGVLKSKSQGGGGSQSPAAGPGGKGRKKGGGKGKSRSPSRSSGSGKSVDRSLPCSWFQSGKCTRKDCKYEHRMATADEKEKLKKIIKPRSPSPVAGQGICNQFSQTGTCTFGEKCKFKHVSAMPAPAHNKDKGKQKAKAKASS